MKIPGKLKPYGRFVDEDEAYLFYENIKYVAKSAKIKKIDRRI